MIDAELRAFLEVWDRAWADVPRDAPVRRRRAKIEALAAELRGPAPRELEIFDRVASGGPRPVRTKILRRRDLAGPAPCLVFMHGGGFMQGSPETHEDVAREIARGTRHVVVSVDYALAPELPFPAGLEDCVAALRWTFAEAGALGIDAARVAVGGDSAGGTLAAVLCQLARGAAPAPSGQMLFYPMTDTDLARPSYVENADGPIVTTAGCAAMLDVYVPDRALRADPRVAPLRAADFAGLPPAFVAVAEHDPLRDEGLAYAERLAAAGVAVELDRGKGMIHGYLRALPFAAASRLRLARACAWLARLHGTALAVDAA